jgi:hypothetical protein
MISPSAVSGVKLDAQPLTIATAAILYHRFFKEADSAGYDSYVSYHIMNWLLYFIMKEWCMVTYCPIITSV